MRPASPFFDSVACASARLRVPLIMVKFFGRREEKRILLPRAGSGWHRAERGPISGLRVHQTPETGESILSLSCGKAVLRIGQAQASSDRRRRRRAQLLRLVKNPTCQACGGWLRRRAMEGFGVNGRSAPPRQAGPIAFGTSENRRREAVWDNFRVARHPPGIRSNAARRVVSSHPQ